MMDIKLWGVQSAGPPPQGAILSDHTCQYAMVHGYRICFWNLNNPVWAGWLSKRGPFPGTLAAIETPTIVNKDTGEITLTPEALNLEELQIQSIVRRVAEGHLTLLGLVEGSQRLADKLRERLPSALYHIVTGPSTHPPGSPKSYHNDRTIIIVDNMTWGVPSTHIIPYTILSTDEPPVDETEYLFGVKVQTTWSKSLIFVPVHLSYSTQPGGTDKSGMYSVKPAMKALLRLVDEDGMGKPLVLGGDFNFTIDKRGFHVSDAAAPIPLQWLKTEVPSHWTPSTNTPAIFDGIFYANVEVIPVDRAEQDIVDRELEMMLCAMEWSNKMIGQ